MAVSYKKLWKLLIDHDMKKKDLAKTADISNYTIKKMSKGEKRDRRNPRQNLQGTQLYAE